MVNICRVVVLSFSVLGMALLLSFIAPQKAGADPEVELRRLAELASRPGDSLLSRQTTPAQNGQDRLVYAEDFSDPDSGWRTSDDGEATYTYTDGEYQVLVWESFHWASARVDIALENYTVETDARCERGDCEAYGLVFGLNNDWSEFYALAINDGGEYAVWKYTGDQLRRLIDWRSAPQLRPGRASNRIAITREGAEITVGANGETLIRLSDIAFAGLRTTGVFALNTSFRDDSIDVRFDNFRLYTLHEATDYVKHKMVAASSTASRSEARAAVDDDVETWWASGSEEVLQSVYVDAGAEYTIDQVFVDWAAAANEWGLAAWNGSAWEVVAATVAGLNGVRILEFDPHEARFWALLMWTRPESAANYAIREWELRGPSEQSPNLALMKPIFASSSAEDSSAENAVDGNVATRWLSVPVGQQWLLIDFEQALPMDRITIDWADAYAQQYSVLAGVGDQVGWLTRTSEGQGGTETLDFDRTVAQWLLLYLWEPAAPGGFAISEFSVWDTVGGGRLDVGEPISVTNGAAFSPPAGEFRMSAVPLSRVRPETQQGKPSIWPPAPDSALLRRLDQ